MNAVASHIVRQSQATARPREAVASQVSAVITYLRGNALWGGSCFSAFWEICVALLTEKDAQIRVVCEDNVASVAACLADPVVLQSIIMPSLLGMMQDDEDAVCTALRLMAEIALHTPSQWVRDTVWPVLSEQVLAHLFPLHYAASPHLPTILQLTMRLQSKSDSFKVRRAVAVHIGKVSIGCAAAFTAEHIMPCFDMLSKAMPHGTLFCFIT